MESTIDLQTYLSGFLSDEIGYMSLHKLGVTQSSFYISVRYGLNQRWALKTYDLSTDENFGNVIVTCENIHYFCHVGYSGMILLDII